MFLYSTDRGFLPITCISIASLAQAWAGKEPPHVALLVHGVEDDDIVRARRYLEGLGVALTVAAVDGEAFQPWARRRRQSPAKFAPLKFDTWLDEVPERIVYLDSDTLVLDDASTLHAMPLDGCVLGAVDDQAVISNHRVDTLTTKLGIPPRSGYFNSGVMVIDTARWLEEQIGEHAIAVFTERPQILTWNDQCALNAVLEGRWKRLPFRWNALNGSMPRHWPVSIGHYAGWYKPWALGAWESTALMHELVGRDHIERFRPLIAASPWRGEFGTGYWLKQSALTTYRVAYHTLTGKMRQVRARTEARALIALAEAHPELIA